MAVVGGNGVLSSSGAVSVVKSRWLDKYEEEYGLKPVSTSSPVEKAVCQFCVFFGREALTPRHGGTRKRRKIAQKTFYCGPNFRTDNIRMHMMNAHPTKWKEYSELSSEEKPNFFPLENSTPLHPNVPEAASKHVALVAERSLPATKAGPLSSSNAKTTSIASRSRSASPSLQLLINAKAPAACVHASCSAEGSSTVVKKREDYLCWDDYFMGVAFLSAMRSKDPNTQVGACIVNNEKKIVGIGYNGFPNGCNDDQLPWARNAPDHLDTKYPYVCHAEMNAIMNKNSFSVKDCTLYVALFPCNECVKLIIQSGISQIVYLSDKYHHDWKSVAARKMLDMANVTYRQHKVTKTTIEIDFTAIEDTTTMTS